MTQDRAVDLAEAVEDATYSINNAEVNAAFADALNIGARLEMIPEDDDYYRSSHGGDQRFVRAVDDLSYALSEYYDGFKHDLQDNIDFAVNNGTPSLLKAMMEHSASYLDIDTYFQNDNPITAARLDYFDQHYDNAKQKAVQILHEAENMLPSLPSRDVLKEAIIPNGGVRQMEDRSAGIPNSGVRSADKEGPAIPNSASVDVPQPVPVDVSTPAKTIEKNKNDLER